MGTIPRNCPHEITSLGQFLFYRCVRTATHHHRSVNFYFTDESEPPLVSSAKHLCTFIITNFRLFVNYNSQEKIPPDRISPKGWENFAFIQFSKKPAYLLASSIATATATVIKAIKMVAVTIGVVTCADER